MKCQVPREEWEGARLGPEESGGGAGGPEGPSPLEQRCPAALLAVRKRSGFVLC